MDAASSKAAFRGVTPTASCPAGAICRSTHVSWGDAARFCNWLQQWAADGARGAWRQPRPALHAERGDNYAQLMAVVSPSHSGSGAPNISSPPRTSGTRRRITTPSAGRTGSIRQRATRADQHAVCLRARTTPTIYNGMATPIHELPDLGWDLRIVARTLRDVRSWVAMSGSGMRHRYRYRFGPWFAWRVVERLLLRPGLVSLGRRLPDVREQRS